MLGVLAVSASASCGMLAARAPARRLPAGACRTIRMGSLFAEPTAEEAASERRFAERDSRLKLVAERYGLDPDTDGLQIATRAASSLPEEENGTWGDVAFGIARNACILGLLLTGLSALPVRHTGLEPRPYSVGPGLAGQARPQADMSAAYAFGP